MNNMNTGINRRNLSDEFRAKEQLKSSLILEANLLKAQGEFEVAARRFAEAAEIEERLASELIGLGFQEKAFIHRFSAVSCWAQAGDLHRAVTLGEQMLRENNLTTAQSSHLEKYMETLHGRIVQWMSQWSLEPVAV